MSPFSFSMMDCTLALEISPAPLPNDRLASCLILAGVRCGYLMSEALIEVIILRLILFETKFTTDY